MTGSTGQHNARQLQLQLLLLLLLVRFRIWPQNDKVDLPGIVCLCLSGILTAASLVKVVRLNCPRLFLAALCRANGCFGAFHLCLHHSFLHCGWSVPRYAVAFNIWEDYQLATEKENAKRAGQSMNPKSMVPSFLRRLI